MFGSDMKALMEAAQKFANDAVTSQIEDCRAKIAAEQRKLKRLQAQKKFFYAVMKELAKPPKPFKPPKMTAKQRREMK